MGGCMSEKKKPEEGGEKVEAGSRPAASGKISEDELRTAIDRIFDEYDKDKNGSLDKKEVLNLLNNSLGKTNMTEKDVKDFMSKVDSDGSNSIEKGELFRIYKQLFC